MAHVITDACVKDGLCLDACPTESIHPKKDDAKFDAASQMYIDPNECIDCGACASVCTAQAIYPADELPADKQEATEKNAAYFA